MVHHRMIASAMTEFELVRFAASGQRQQLMAETDPGNRHAAEHRFDIICRIGNGSGSPGPLESRRPSGLISNMSFAEVEAGTTVTLQPSRVKQRRMLYLTP